MSFFLLCADAFLIALSLSVDSFVAAFSYGAARIKIPFSSVGIISLTSSLITGISMLIGSFVKEYIPDGFTSFLSFGILFLLGILKLSDSCSPVNADKDHSQSISPKEALSLSAALSLDGCAAGFGASLPGTVSGLPYVAAVFLFSLLSGTFMVLIGSVSGRKAAGRLPIKPGIVGGLLLILLAFARLL